MDTVSRKALIDELIKFDATLNLTSESCIVDHITSIVESLPSTESEGEAARMSEALKYVHGELIGGNIFSQNGLARALTKIESALEGSTSETAVNEQKQQIIDLWDNSHQAGGKLAYKAYRLGMSHVLQILGVSIPGIKDGREEA